LRKGALRLDGVVLLDKPAGITSNAALQRVRRSR
jgi:tRNA U55 pseudouridine synthase TruB